MNTVSTWHNGLLPSLMRSKSCSKRNPRFSASLGVTLHLSCTCNALSKFVHDDPVGVLYVLTESGTPLR